MSQLNYNWDIARENMRKIRIKHNMTIFEMESRLGWSQSSIGSYELGNRTPTILYVIAF